MENNDITSRQTVHMSFCIRDEFKKITGNPIFADNESYKIMSPISYMYAGHVMPHWLTIYNSLTKEQLFDIFYYQIVNYIGEETSLKYTLFKSFKCGKVDNYVDENNLCTSCSDDY